MIRAVAWKRRPLEDSHRAQLRAALGWNDFPYGFYETLSKATPEGSLSPLFEVKYTKAKLPVLSDPSIWLSVFFPAHFEALRAAPWEVSPKHWQSAIHDAFAGVFGFAAWIDREPEAVSLVRWQGLGGLHFIVASEGGLYWAPELKALSTGVLAENLTDAELRDFFGCPAHHVCLDFKSVVANSPIHRITEALSYCYAEDLVSPPEPSLKVVKTPNP